MIVSNICFPINQVFYHVQYKLDGPMEIQEYSFLIKGFLSFVLVALLVKPIFSTKLTLGVIHKPLF